MQSRSTSRAIALDGASNYLRFAASMGIWVLLIPYIINRVGTEAFGLWTLVHATIGVLGLLDMGLATGTVKFVALCRGTGDVARRNRLVSTLFFVYLALASLATLGVTVIAPAFGPWFQLSVTQEDAAIKLLWLVAARSLLFSLPLGLFRSILFAEQRIYLINAVQLTANLLYALAVWVLLEGGHGIVAMGWAGLVTTLLEHLAIVLLATRYVAHLRVSWRLADPRMLPELMSFSAYQAVVNVSVLVLLRLDPIIIKLFLPLTSVAVYGVALKVAENVQLLIKQFINALTPHIGALHGAGDDGGIRDLFIRGTRLATALTAALFAPIWLYAPEGIRLWIGPDFQAAVPVIRILLVTVLVATPQLMAANVLNMTGHHRYLAVAALLAMGLNVGSSLALAGTFHLVGIAAGTLISVVVVDVFIVRRACACHAVRFGEYARRALAPALLPALLQFAATIYLHSEYPPSHLGALVLQGSLSVLVYAAVFVPLGLEPSERQLLATALSSITNRVLGFTWKPVPKGGAS